MTTPNPHTTEPWRKTHRACNVCDKQATGCYSPDLDIKGLCFCAEHKDEVQLVYVMLMQGTPEMAEEAMKSWANK